MTESARQISPTRQKLRDCRARRPSILSSSHCRCCQPRRVPPSLSAKSCDAPLAPIGAAVGIPATEGRGVFRQKEAKYLNGRAACKKGVAGASSDNGNGGYLWHLLFGISPFFSKALAAKSVVALAWGFRRPQSVGTRPDRSTIPIRCFAAMYERRRTPLRRPHTETMSRR